MPTYDDVAPALKWRSSQIAHPTAETLADALTVGQLRYTEIPTKLWPSVRAFRRLRTDARLNAARKYLMLHTAV